MKEEKKELVKYDFELGKIIIKPDTDLGKADKVIQKRIKKIKEIKTPTKDPESKE